MPATTFTPSPEQQEGDRPPWRSSPSDCLRRGEGENRQCGYFGMEAEPIRQVVIENPIINSPFEEPKRHFRFDDEGITNEIVGSRRSSCYFIPIAKPKKGKEKQTFFEEWTQDRVEENKTINDIRQCVKVWREGRYTDDVSRVTARLLEYWTATRPRADDCFSARLRRWKPSSTSPKSPRSTGDTWIENELRRANEDANPVSTALPARWRPAPAKPWSWPC